MSVPSRLATRGSAKAARGDVDGGIADLSEAARVAPGAGPVYVARGLLYAGKREWGKAVADYTEAIKANPPGDEDRPREQAS